MRKSTTPRSLECPGHRWDMSPKEAVELQKELASKIILKPFDATEIRYIAGVDISTPSRFQKVKNKFEDGIAAAVVYDIESGETVDTALAVGKLQMAYIPGLLSFRECPLAIEAIGRLKKEADIIMADGQGIAHPRRFGIASHLGILLGKRTFGCAKSILVGKVNGKLGDKAGSWKELIDGGEVVGAAYRNRAGVKPVYLSPGHLCDLESIIALMKRLGGRYRIPEPARRAHILATQMRGRAV